MPKLLLVAVLSCLPLPLAAEHPEVDWEKVATETINHFTALLRIDTSNPPGNETKAASYIQQVLEKEDIPSRLFALEPDRANLVARIRGNGSKKPLLVMGHTDVVGVQRERWSVDPFGGVRKDGFIWGRGAIDDKDNVAAGLMLMLLLKRMNVALDRDVIFLAEAGEEATPRVGIDYMVDKHWDEIDAEYCLAEGGFASARNGEVRYVAIATTEKVPARAHLIARGTAGHGSVPRTDNAVARLAAAVAKVADWQPPMRLNETTRVYFERLATISPPEEAARYNHVVGPVRRPHVERYLAVNDPFHYSMLRTSVAPTILNGGFRINVIPSEAEAGLDIRALPDEDIDAFYADLLAVVNDPNVEILPLPRTRPPAPPSRMDNEMFRVLEGVNRRMFPESVVLPLMLTGATDMAQLRAKGVQCYGFGAIRDEADSAAGRGAHGDDERIAEEALLKLLQFLWFAVLDVAANDG